MATLRLTARQIDRAMEIKEGDTLTLNPYWNQTSGPSLKLPDNPICQGIAKGAVSQTGLRFNVGNGKWLDAAWFVFPDTPPA